MELQLTAFDSVDETPLGLGLASSNACVDAHESQAMAEYSYVNGSDEPN